VTVVDNTATVNGRLTVSWTGLAGLTIDAGAGDNTLSVRGTPLDRGAVTLAGGAGANTYALATRDSAVRVVTVSGRDTLDFSNATAGVTVDLGLDRGQPQTIGGGNNTLALRGIIENLIGTPHDDVLLGNDAGNTIRGLGGHDVLSGFGGHDLLDGGDGDDVLTAGDGNTILLGGAGDDVLRAGTGRNLLIGGAGTDLLFSEAGRRGGSTLVGGGTAFDTNQEALDALLAEWSSDRPLRTRIANLRDGSGSRHRLNGDYFLNADTLIDDGVADLLFGDSRRDWFLAFPGDRVIDRNPRR
jgi:Ca2+-binding RTX toxin-like protein